MTETIYSRSANKDFSCGILYVATGEKYIQEVIASATSCKQSNPYPIGLITDSPDYELPNGLFDTVLIKDAQYTYRDKLLIRYTPFQKTIFLDTDTFVISDLSDLFRLLDFREFAVYQQDEGYEYEMPELSNAMPEFNTGVIAFRMTDDVRGLFAIWDASFDIVPKIITDQYHLRKALYKSNVKYAIFSSAYNFIVSYNNYVIQQVKVLHGRPIQFLMEVAKQINNVPHESAWRRTFYPINDKFFILYTNPTAKDSFKLLRSSTRMYLGNVIRKIKNGFK